MSWTREALRPSMGLHSRSWKINFINWRDFIVPIWKITLGVAAILDILNCSLATNSIQAIIRECSRDISWCSNGAADTCSAYAENLQGEAARDVPPDGVCTRGFYYVLDGINWPVMQQLPSMLQVFAIMCIVEAILRARQAQIEAYESAALDVFEEKLAGLCYATRCSIFGERHVQLQQDLDEALARQTLRIWMPVLSTLFFWFMLIPWFSLGNRQSEEDGALLSYVISHATSRWILTFAALQKSAFSHLKKKAAAMIIRRPKKSFHAIQTILRWIRFFRFAGPILRMLDKLQSKIRDLLLTQRQSKEAKATKESRIHQRSLLKEDIRKVLSLQRVESAMRNVRSQAFNLASEHYQLVPNSKVGSNLSEEKMIRQNVRQRAMSLQHAANSSSANLSEVYDRFVDLTKETSTKLQKDIWNSNLIPPNTKFGIMWRVVVSCSLVLELCRLMESWKLAGNFHLTFADVLHGRLATATMAKNNALKTNWWLKLFKNGSVKFKKASDIEWQARLSIPVLMGNVIEFGVGMVCFIDIFVWFYTGEIDSTGIVVPKPFFPRCVLPGTIAQVFDHPTLPNVLPSFLSRIAQFVSTVGYARIVRWCVALEPLVKMAIVEPFRVAFLHPTGTCPKFGLESSGSFIY